MKDLKIYSEWFKHIKQVLTIHLPSVKKNNNHTYIVSNGVSGSPYFKKIIGIIELEASSFDQLENQMSFYIFKKLKRHFTITEQNFSNKKDSIWINCFKVLFDRMMEDIEMAEVYSDMFGGILNCSSMVKNIILHNLKIAGLKKESEFLIEYWHSNSFKLENERLKIENLITEEDNNFFREEKNDISRDLIIEEDVEIAGKLVVELEGFEDDLIKRLFINQSLKSCFFYQYNQIQFIVKLSKSSNKEIDLIQQEYDFLTQTNDIVKRLYIVQDIYFYPKVFWFEDINKSILEGSLKWNKATQKLEYSYKKEYQKY